MAVIRVNPESVRTYATNATTKFADARAQLESLVRAAVEVRYYGPNATQFKTSCGQLCADFSAQLLNDFVKIAEAMRVSTSNIAGSLGGTAIAITVDGTAVPVPPVPADDGTFDVDPTALEGLKTVVTNHISAVQTALTDHLTALTNTDWDGAAKASAVQAVSSFTTLAQNKATEARTQINQYIETQITSVMAADK